MIRAIYGASTQVKKAYMVENISNPQNDNIIITSTQIGEPLDVSGVDVRSLAAAWAPTGIVALTSRKGLWIAEIPTEPHEELSLSRALLKDASGKWLDCGAAAWCPLSTRRGWLGVLSNRSALLWDVQRSITGSRIDSGGDGQRSLTDIDWGAAASK